MQNYASLKNIFNQNNIYIISVILFLAVATGNLVGTNILSTQGVNVNASEIEILKLEKQNHALLVKIEEESKLKDLEQIALSKGFVRTSNLVFAPTASTVALR